MKSSGYWFGSGERSRTKVHSIFSTEDGLALETMAEVQRIRREKLICHI